MIPTDKTFTETARKLRVRYYPVHNDGGLGHAQEAYLPWEGDEIEGEALIAAAQAEFARRYGPGQDKVVGAWIM